MTEIEDLKKAIGLVEQAAEILKKSQMNLFGDGKQEQTNRRTTEEQVAFERGLAGDKANRPDWHKHKADMHSQEADKAFARGEAKLGTYHDKMAEAHHVAYTRTSASGTVSQIQAKGANPEAKAKSYMANKASADANTLGTASRHEAAAVAHRKASMEYHPTTQEHREHLNAAEYHQKQADTEAKLEKDHSVGAAPAKQGRPSDHAAASEQAEVASKHAWTEDDTQDGHDEAERALVHSASLHEKAAEEADRAGDPRTSKWHERKADLHRQMAEEHGAESHRIWTAEQQAKQVAATNAKMAKELDQIQAKGAPRVHSDEAFSKIKAAGGTNVHTTSDYIHYYHKGAPKKIAHVDDADGHRYVDAETLDNHLEALKGQPAHGSKFRSGTPQYQSANDHAFAVSSKAATRDQHLKAAELHNIAAGHAQKDSADEDLHRNMAAEHRAKGQAPRPPTPQTGIPASRVHVDTKQHFNSHLKEPKGRGGWFFSKHTDIDFANHKEGEDHISTPSMTYADAKKYAKEWAAKKGYSLIHVMP